MARVSFIDVSLSDGWGARLPRVGVGARGLHRACHAVSTPPVRRNRRDFNRLRRGTGTAGGRRVRRFGKAGAMLCGDAPHSRGRGYFASPVEVRMAMFLAPAFLAIDMTSTAAPRYTF